jgi:hypothetical protein
MPHIIFCLFCCCSSSYKSQLNKIVPQKSSSWAANNLNAKFPVSVTGDPVYYDECLVGIT